MEAQVSWADLNPVKKAGKREGVVLERKAYARLLLTGRILGIHAKEPGTPFLLIDGLDPLEAAEELSGADLDFAKAPREWHRELETGSGRLRLRWAEMRPFVKRA